MIPPRTEIMGSLFGAWCLIRFDPRGLNYFNHTVDGFWRSFFAAVIALPLFLTLSIIHTHGVEAGRSSSTSIHLLRYALGWIVFPVVMVILARLLGRAGLYASYIIAVNWMAAPQWALVLAASSVGMALGGTAGDLVPMLLLVLLLCYDFFITRLALDIGIGKTVLVVTIGVLLGVVLDALILRLG